jgi:hypothetical protein
LVVEPALFMALVPADRALEIVQEIKKKYDKEMARVRDRLPLHLGCVFAPRRTPLAAVLEAGRRILGVPSSWEKWTVEAQGWQATFSQRARRITWDYPSKMQDEETDDRWYANLLTADPSEADPEEHLMPVKAASGEVYIRPSYFDFEFLDTTARRFEVDYDRGEEGPQRATHPSRPWLLDDLPGLECLWKHFCNLEKSQRHQVVRGIEQAREDWFPDDPRRSWEDQTFRRFVRDTLAGANWPEKKTWAKQEKETREALVTIGLNGQLADLYELHEQILKEKGRE